MTNYSRKLAALIVGLNLFALVPALAGECAPNHKFDLADLNKTAAEVGSAPVVKITDAQKAAMLKNKGQPPHTQGDFDAYIMSSPKGDIEAVVIVQDDCMMDMLGPAPTEVINAIVTPGDSV